MKVLVLGVTGMLGYSIFSNLSERPGYEVFGTARSLVKLDQFFRDKSANIINDVDMARLKDVERAISLTEAEVVINCVGLIKQQATSKNHVDAIKINALLPHELASLCDRFSAKFIHFSTDCVFDGAIGNYSASDVPTAKDLYGRSKLLGEVDYKPHLTLRTSIIGHELKSNLSLIDWFLSANHRVKGYNKAIFSGLPTVYVADLLAEYILVRPRLSGLYHLSASPIDKLSLLRKVAYSYGKAVEIIEDDENIIDRSLDSAPLQKEIGWTPPSWDELIAYMHEDYLKRYKFCVN